MKKLAALATGLFTVLLLSASAQDASHKAILLWPNGAPGSEGKTAAEHISKNARGEISISSINFPSITPYLPAKGKANGLAVIIAPGGGHKELKMDYEGSNFAEWLTERGVTCFVLKYRLAKENNSTYTVEGHALKDMQRAIRLVRSRATEFGIDTARLCAMGFSAGGELAGLASIKFDYGNANSPDPVERQSSRPNVQLLVYPGGYAGFEPVKNSPPLFITCGSQDDPARIKGVTDVYLKYAALKIPAELHMYYKAVHGFGVRKTTEGAVIGWPERFYEWLADIGFVKNAGVK